MASGCGDVLSLQDLKTAKLHQIFEAEAITGRAGGVAGGVPIDYASNQVTGQIQKTMPAILRDIGFQPAGFDFTTGGTLTNTDRDAAVLWPLSSRGDGSWYYWEGTLPKVIPAASTPASTGGVVAGAWRPVGDIALRGQLSSTSSDLLGDALVGVKQPFSGSSPRSQHDFNRQIPSVLDGAGVAGDGVTDSTAGINAAIAGVGPAGELLAPSYSSPEASKYKITGITNPYGVPFRGRGAIVLPDPNGGVKQINYHQDEYYPVLGYEYLYSMYQKLTPGQASVNATMNIFLYGDSTIAGNNGESPAFKADAYLREQLTKVGVPNVNVVNRGVGGTSINDMNAIPDVTASADVFIIKYGINDGGNGRPDRLAYFTTTLRDKLAAIRALTYGALTNLSIILVGPNSTNDSVNNRNAYWYEQLRNIYVRAARDYQCAYFDTYSMMPDSYGLAGTVLDAPPSLAAGVGIHPMNLGQSWIWGKFIDTFFNRSSIAPFNSNNFINSGSISGRPQASVTPLNYQFGLNVYRGTPTDGYNVDGSVITLRAVDGPSLQWNHNFAAGPSINRTRTYNTAGNTWNVASGVATGLTIANGGTATTSPAYIISADGQVTITGAITGGTVTASTTILSGLPTYLRPAAEKRFAQCNTDGSHIAIGVNTSGNIFLVTAASAAGFHINLSYYI